MNIPLQYGLMQNHAIVYMVLFAHHTHKVEYNYVHTTYLKKNI